MRLTREGSKNHVLDADRNLNGKGKILGLSGISEKQGESLLQCTQQKGIIQSSVTACSKRIIHAMRSFVKILGPFLTLFWHGQDQDTADVLSENYCYWHGQYFNKLLALVLPIVFKVSLTTL